MPKRDRNLRPYIHHPLRSSIPILDKLECAGFLIVVVYFKEDTLGLGTDGVVGWFEVFEKLFYVLGCDSYFDVEGETEAAWSVWHGGLYS